MVSRNRLKSAGSGVDKKDRLVKVEKVYEDVGAIEKRTGQPYTGEAHWAVKTDTPKIFTTTIKPKPPFYLFIPSIREIPTDLKEKNTGRAFALGEFYDSDASALQAVKKSGYTHKEELETLKQQGYLALRGSW